MSLTKSQLEALNNSSFPNNNAGYITPEILRTYNSSSIAAFVDENTYIADSASFDSRIDALSPVSGNFVSEVVFNQFTQSTNTFTQSYYVDSASFDSRLDSEEFKSTTFATTGSNTFVGNQTINGNVNITGSLTASGLKYPTADNGAKSFIQTDGNGNLSLQYVDAVFETVRNMSGVPLDKGTPVYISGSTGDNGNAYVADASDSAKMPAIYILGEDLAAGATGIALVGGLIEGVNTTGYPAGTIIYVAEGGGWTSSRPSGSSSIVQVLGVVQKEGSGGQGVVINQLEATLPNIQTGYAWVGNGSNQPVAVATSSFGGGGTIDTSSFATTGSNNFVGNQTITGSLYVSSSDQKDVIIEGQLWVSSSNLFASGTTVQPQINIVGAVGGTAGGSRTGSIAISPNQISLARGSRTAIVSNNVINVSDTSVGAAGQSAAIYPTGIDNGTLSGDEIGLTINGGILGVTNFSGPSIWIADNTLAYKAVFGFQDTTTYTDGAVTVLTPLSASAGITSSNALLNGELYSVTSASFDSRLDNIETAGYVTSAITGSSLVTASIVGTTLTFTKGDSTTFDLTLPTGSGGTIDTSSFATTGSNSFIGNQTITGTLLVSSSTSVDVNVLGRVAITGPTTGQIPILYVSSSDATTTLGRFSNVASNTTHGTAFTYTTNFGSYVQLYDVAGTKAFGFTLSGSAFGLTNWNGPTIYGQSDVGGTTTGFIGFEDGTNYTDGRVTILTPLSASAGIIDARISGSLEITGGIAGNITEVTVASSTASIDFSKGSFFTLTIPSSSVTYITGSNLKPGQTANIVLTQQSTTGSVIFESTLFKFPSGSINTGSAVASAVDMVSVAAINSTTLYSVTARQLQ